MPPREQLYEMKSRIERDGGASGRKEDDELN